MNGHSNRGSPPISGDPIEFAMRLGNSFSSRCFSIGRTRYLYDILGGLGCLREARSVAWVGSAVGAPEVSVKLRYEVHCPRRRGCMHSAWDRKVPRLPVILMAGESP